MTRIGHGVVGVHQSLTENPVGCPCCGEEYVHRREKSFSPSVLDTCTNILHITPPYTTRNEASCKDGETGLVGKIDEPVTANGFK